LTIGVEQFGREASLIVAPVGGGAGVELSSLRVSFEIERTSTSEPNAAVIQIYNLSAATRGLLQEKDQGVELRAGYKDLVQRLFVGVVRRVEHRREGVDVVTELECKDGGIALLEPVFQRSYARGTAKQKIVNDIIREMPGAIIGPVSSGVLRGATSGKLSFSDSCKRALDKLAKAWRFEWSIQDGEVQILSDSGTREGRELAEVFSVDTGLIGTPTKIGRDATSGKGKAGARWSSLLRPALIPGGYALLESEFLTGAYKVESVVHRGDTHGSSWETDAEGVLI